jgi:hypothetical protein
LENAVGKEKLVCLSMLSIMCSVLNARECGVTVDNKASQR